MCIKVTIGFQAIDKISSHVFPATPFGRCIKYLLRFTGG